jgi:hypothetical protein
MIGDQKERKEKGERRSVKGLYQSMEMKLKEVRNDCAHVTWRFVRGANP